MNRMKLRMILSMGTTFMLALALAPAALAQSSSVDTYSPGGGDVAAVAAGGDDSGDSGDSGSPSGTAASSSSALPFSGLDVGLLAGGGFLLLLIGVGMARMVPRDQDAT